MSEKDEIPSPKSSNGSRHSSIGSLGLVGSIIAIAGGLTAVIWFVHQPARSSMQYLKSDVTGSMASMFTNTYPASERFQSELLQLRSQGRLKIADELLINRWILTTSEHLQIPPAILWCLLFQESRLNHLEGVEGDRSASGIGQFSHFSFYEVNHHLDKYTKDNLNLFINTIGKDIRPIEARKRDLHNASSYYFIPTAVISSAVYLNNRYHHLQKTLDKHGIPYDRQLLWFYAAMAYNKGMRSVLSFWNDARKQGGKRRVEKLVLENDTLLKSMNDPLLLTRSLKSIWGTEDANLYARELKIHLANFRECVLPPPPKLDGVGEKSH